ncbi:MAG: hypothetical protein QG673_2140 [Pseudomonadota bacterium]|nr:hypothetical protein [Pseudomonadota bacterium]
MQQFANNSVRTFLTLLARITLSVKLLNFAKIEGLSLIRDLSSSKDTSFTQWLESSVP